MHNVFIAAVFLVATLSRADVAVDTKTPDSRFDQNTTILGTDRDGDKVRDDLQSMIAQQPGISDTAKALESRISTNLDSLMTTSDPVQIERLWSKYLQLENCLQARVALEGKDIRASVEFSSRLFAKQMNSRLRTQAFLNAKKAIRGKVFTIRDNVFDSTCMEMLRP